MRWHAHVDFQLFSQKSSGIPDSISLHFAADDLRLKRLRGDRTILLIHSAENEILPSVLLLDHVVQIVFFPPHSGVTVEKGTFLL